MPVAIPYCGIAPVPGTLAGRVNADPVLAAALLLLFLLHRRVLHAAHGARAARCAAVAGWLVAAIALMSPLCALSVALFSARVTQHMVLLLLAAPLLALALPPRAACGRHFWPWSFLFMAALWFWHMPVPYDATFTSTPIYWTMHITLTGSAILLWRELLHHGPEQGIGAFAAGMFTSMQMGVLGALLAFAGHPQFIAHLSSTQAWGLTPLQDQQLGGTIMWVPGVLVFLWVALRSVLRSGAAGRLRVAG